MRVRRLYEGGDYSRAAFIRGNTVYIYNIRERERERESDGVSTCTCTCTHVRERGDGERMDFIVC